jgi:hypothetical protein
LRFRLFLSLGSGRLRAEVELHGPNLSGARALKDNRQVLGRSGENATTWAVAQQQTAGPGGLAISFPAPPSPCQSAQHPEALGLPERTQRCNSVAFCHSRLAFAPGLCLHSCQQGREGLSCVPHRLISMC